VSESCAGLRVLDLTAGMPGAIATMVLADAGADVLKVEPPDGDPFGDMPAYHQWLRGKRVRRLDLKTPEGRAEIATLASEADVLVESMRPGVMERLGLGYDTLSAANPRLVRRSPAGLPRLRGPCLRPRRPLPQFRWPSRAARPRLRRGTGRQLRRRSDRAPGYPRRPDSRCPHRPGPARRRQSAACAHRL